MVYLKIFREIEHYALLWKNNCHLNLFAVKTWITSGYRVNFTSILWAAFCTKVKQAVFLHLQFRFKCFRRKIISGKATSKILAKLAKDWLASQANGVKNQNFIAHLITVSLVNGPILNYFMVNQSSPLQMLPSYLFYFTQCFIFRSNKYGTNVISPITEKYRKHSITSSQSGEKAERNWR